MTEKEEEEGRLIQAAEHIEKAEENIRRLSQLVLDLEIRGQEGPALDLYRNLLSTMVGTLHVMQDHRHEIARRVEYLRQKGSESSSAI